VYAAKRLIGRKHESKTVQSDLPLLSYKVVKESNGLAYIDIEGKPYSPAEISAFILQKMKQTAEDYLGDKVTEAVFYCSRLFR
jgi:molecular chaperone DnaK